MVRILTGQDQSALLSDPQQMNALQRCTGDLDDRKTARSVLGGHDRLGADSHDDIHFRIALHLGDASMGTVDEIGRVDPSVNDSSTPSSRLLIALQKRPLIDCQSGYDFAGGNSNSKAATTAGAGSPVLRNHFNDRQ